MEDSLVDLLLRSRTELLQIVGEAEAVQHPFVLCLEERIVKCGQRPGELILFVQEELEGSGERHLDRSAAYFRIPLRSM